MTEKGQPSWPVGFYRRVFGVLNDAVLLTDANGHVTDCNPAAEAMFGWSRADLLGRVPGDRTDPVGADQRSKEVLAAVSRDESWRADVPFVRKDGSIRISETKVVALRSETGALIGTVSINRDVTALRRTTAELAAAEERWRLTLDNAPFGIAVLALDGRCLRVNSALSRLTGFSEADLKSKTIVDLTYAEDRGLDRKLLSDLRAGKREHSIAEKRYVTAQGDPVWISESVALVRDGWGSPLHIVAFVEDITERRSTTERLERMALRDHLTGLGNRAALHQQLKQLLAQGQRDLVAVVYVDLDGFKEVNDSHGHEAGDELLRLTAQRLEASLRSHDFCARLGGDEFALVLTQLEKVEDVPPIAERLLAALGSPYHLTNFSVNVTASVGIAVAGADRASDDLLRLADRAMYAAKQQGKNAWVIEPHAAPEPDPPRS